jgi:hypothetical protein
MSRGLRPVNFLAEVLLDWSSFCELGHFARMQLLNSGTLRKLACNFRPLDTRNRSQLGLRFAGQRIQKSLRPTGRNRGTRF